MHVDDFIDNPASNDYAAFVLNYFRMAAICHVRWDKYMAENKLFCTYGGHRFRVTGASRLVCCSQSTKALAVSLLFTSIPQCARPTVIFANKFKTN